MLRFPSFFALVLAMSCGATPSDPPAAPDLRILFIGNSLTSVNDLPGLVVRLSHERADRTVSVRSVTFGNYSLDDHWQRGAAQQAIAEGGWDLVVLQQGPSALPESRELLVAATRQFDARIREAGARTALYMVWPPLSRASEWDAVTTSYAVAASAVNGVLFPAGEALRSARAAGGVELFDADGFHPSLAGSYAAALVIYARAAGVSPAGVLGRSGVAELSPAVQATLETAAARALAEHP